MEKEIYDIIKKNLPAEVGETLRGVLEQGQKDAQRLSEREKELFKALNDIEDLTIKLQGYQKLDARNESLDKRESDIAKREQKAIEDELRFQLKEVEKRTTDMFTLVSLLVKNPRVIEFMSSNSTEQHDRLDQYGSPHPMYGNTTVNGTKETEFTKD